MGKKRNRKAIVITALIMLAGILLVLTGFRRLVYRALL
jgi:hypothetical protein